MTTEMEDDDPWQVKRKIEGPVRGPAIVCLGRKIRNRPVVYFGLNKAAHVESAIVGRCNAAKGGVTKIINADYTDAAIDQRTEGDRIRQSVTTWCLPENKVDSVVSVIEELRLPRAKLLLLLLAEVYAQAETGRRQMDRVMLSGESYGEGLHSNDPERMGVRLDFADFIKLARIFPAAAGTVKHLFVSACSAGFPGNIDVYRDMFPRVQTIMAYASKSPEGRSSMVRSDIEYWISKTDREGCRSLAPIEQRPDPADPKSPVKITVATWSALDKEYRVYEMPLRKLLAEIKRLEPAFMDLLTGRVEPKPGPGVADEYYRHLTDIVKREEGPAPELLSTYKIQREQVMRLRHWGKIRVRFGVEYAEQLHAGFYAARKETPQFAAMKRRALMKCISDLTMAPERDDTLTSDQRAAISEALRLVQGLYDLNGKVVPEEWFEIERQRH